MKLMNCLLALSFAMTAGICEFKSQSIQLYSIADARQIGGDRGYTLDGEFMVPSRAKLLKQRYFGPAGIYPKKVLIKDGFAISGSLKEVTSLPQDGLFFMGSFNTKDPTIESFTTEEIDSLYSWSMRGGKMIITSGLSFPSNAYYSDILNSKWNYVTGVKGPSSVVPTETGYQSGLFSGPFGIAYDVSQGGSLQGFFHKVPDNIKIMAKDENGKPTVYHDCETLDMMVIDVDIFTSLSGLSQIWGGIGISFRDSIFTGNDIFWANTIAFMDKLQGPPVLSKDKDKLSVAGNYLNYQWYKDDEPINGANGPELTIEPNNMNNYYVQVEVNGGCKVTSDKYSRECDIFVPSAFSPDNNAMNDKACAYSACISKINFKIFSRWGELVFESNDKATCWDGIYKGVKANSGVYAWSLEATDASGKKISKKGNITLIR